MNNNVSRYYDKNNDIWGLPQKYSGINFYPIKLSDVEYQRMFGFLFTQAQMVIPDAEVLRMSYLKFVLIYLQRKINKDQFDTYFILRHFLEYVTKEKVEIFANCNIISDLGFFRYPELCRLAGDANSRDINIKIRIGNYEIDEGQFDDIREIILEQNGLSIEYVNEYDPSLEDKLSILSGNELTFEDEIFSFCALAKCSMSDIKDYTLYQYKNLVKRLLVLKDYETYKPLEASGQIKIKNGEIRHYLSHFEKEGRYSSILMKTEKFLSESGLSEVSNLEK